MHKSIIVIILLAHCLAIHSAVAGDDASSRISYGLNVRGETVDLYAANAGVSDVSTSNVPQKIDLGTKVIFRFFRDGKLCQSCVYSRLEGGLQFPLEKKDALRPGEIGGLMLSGSEMKEYFNLVAGCYTFYAIVTDSFDKRRSKTRFISNIARICVRG